MSEKIKIVKVVRGCFNEINGGEDEHGCNWMTFEVDYLAEQEDGTCAICGATLSEGWLCLDGAEEVCSDHIELDEKELDTLRK